MTEGRSYCGLIPLFTTPWPGGRPTSSGAPTPRSRCCCAEPSTMPGGCLKRLDRCQNEAGRQSIADCRAAARLFDWHSCPGGLQEGVATVSHDSRLCPHGSMRRRADRFKRRHRYDRLPAPAAHIDQIAGRRLTPLGGPRLSDAGGGHSELVAYTLGREPVAPGKELTCGGRCVKEKGAAHRCN